MVQHLLCLLFIFSSLCARKAASLSTLDFTTSQFVLSLDNRTQNLISLRPVETSDNSTTFDFLPFDVFANRSAPGQHHTGDVSLRVRAANSTGWIAGDSAASSSGVLQLPVSGSSSIAAADLTNLLPSELTSLVRVVREYSVIPGSEGSLALCFNLTNISPMPVEIGGLGFPLEVNNIMTDRTAADMAALCSFLDPAIASDGGYARATRISGAGPALVVTPAPGTRTPLDAWRFLTEDEGPWPYYQSQTFEGVYSWEVFTTAYADKEWAGVVPWNEPRSKVLGPEETLTVGLRFDIAVEPEGRGVERVLEEVGRPVVVGIPGYVLPADTVGRLFIKYSSSDIVNVAADPPEAVAIQKDETVQSRDWKAYQISPAADAWGRVRISLSFANEEVMTVQYYLTKSAPAALHDLGKFLFKEQWFDPNDTDPFDRAPSVISYDRAVNSQVLQDPRVWIPGLSDEGGAGSWLAAAQKLAIQPEVAQVAQFQRFIDDTVWGGLQYRNGSKLYGVRAHMFFYQPDAVPSYVYNSSIDWRNWWSYDEAHSETVIRAYNYVHVVAAYWAMSRVARSWPDLVDTHRPEWFLMQAGQTLLAAVQESVGYWDQGLMGETVFLFVLEDLQNVNLTLATAIENKMRQREEIWAGLEIPFGSEMAWDSTGQEGVYLWASYFGDQSTMEKTLASVFGYTPAVPHWGWNGNARRYWDNIYAGKLQRIERQIHHYGSALNALPLLAHFRSTPSDIHALRIGHAGIMAPLTSIDQGGFAAASFHSFPDTLAWDAYSGDYGPGFSGMAMGAGCYLVRSESWGWVAFGGNTEVNGNSTVMVSPRDAVRRRVYIAEWAVYLELDSGAIQTVELHLSQFSMAVSLLPTAGGLGEPARRAGMRITAIEGYGTWTPQNVTQKEDGWWGVELGGGGGVIVTIAQQ